MTTISSEVLFGKLNSLGYRAIEAAFVFCKLRGNPYVELVHWLHQILQLQDSDLHRLIKHFDLNASKVAADLTAALDKLPRGSTSFTDLSSNVELATERAWTYATLMFKNSAIRTGHLVVGLVLTEQLRNVLRNISREFDRIKPDTLTDDFAKILAGSPEEGQNSSDGMVIGGAGAPGEASGAIAPAALGKQEALKRFSVDLTERARSGKLDPILGRDEEIRSCIAILMRRRQNNPILVGSAGVGKTAVVEGFAQRIASGDVPPALKDVTVRTLDITLMSAGASMKGEFEQRLQSVMEEVRSSPKPIILFIDETHTLIGAGGQAGTGDAANLLKPALARGELRTIGATTYAEYKKYIQEDPALARRFEAVTVDEPSEAKAIIMMRGIASVQEKHHRVQVLDEALEAAVKLSHRYIPARQLPDKAVVVLDTACARVAVGQHSVPPEVEDSRQRIRSIETEIAIVDREQAVGLDHVSRRTDLVKNIATEKDRLKGLEERWGKEKDLVTQILDLRGKLRAAGEKVDEMATLSAASAPENAAAMPHDAGAGTQAAATGTLTDKSPSEAPASPAVPTRTSTDKSASEAPASPVDRVKLLADLQLLQSKLAELQGEEPLILPSVDAQAVAAVVADWTGIPVGRMVKNEIEAVLKLADSLEKRVIGQRHALDAIANRIRITRAQLDDPNRPIGVFLLVGPSGVGKTETALSLAETLYGGEQNVVTLNMSEFQSKETASTLVGSAKGLVGYGEGGVLTEAIRRKPYSVVLLDEFEKGDKSIHTMFLQVFDSGKLNDSQGNTANFRNTVILLTSNVGSAQIMNLCKDPDTMPDPAGIAKALRPALLEKFPAELLGRLVVVPYYPISDAMLKTIIGLQLGRIGKRLKDQHKAPFTYDDSVIQTIRDRCTEQESGARAVNAILSHTILPALSSEVLNRMAQGKAVKRVHVSTSGKDLQYAFD